jgi:hypothetical protein
MTELRERMLSAERSVTAAQDLAGAKERVFRAVRRRRATRSAGVTVAALVVVGGAAVVAASFLDTVRPTPPAEHPTVQATVVDASDMSTYDVGEMPAAPVPRRAWDEVDNRWAMAVWAPVNAAWKNSFALDYPLLLTAPDGRSWTAATVKGTVAPQILAWDPVTRKALVISGATSAPTDANLGAVSLDDGQDVFTSECLDGAPPPNAERWATPVDRGFAVHNGCGEEFFTEDGSVRRNLTEAEQVALWDAKYPFSGIAEVQWSDHDAQVGNTALGIDPSSCVILVRPRQHQVGSGCNVGDGFNLDDGTNPVWLTSLPGVAGQPSITKLCGAGTAFGTLSDGSVGVGVVQVPYVLPLVLNGAPATACRDRLYTWYLAGGNLYFSVNMDQATRVIAINSIPEDVPEGAGVVDVAPAPSPNSLG